MEFRPLHTHSKTWLWIHKHTTYYIHMTQPKENHLIERDNDIVFCCIFTDIATAQHLHLVHHFKVPAHPCPYPHYPLLRQGHCMFLSTPPLLHVVGVCFAVATHSVFLVLMLWGTLKMLNEGYICGYA